MAQGIPSKFTVSGVKLTNTTKNLLGMKPSAESCEVITNGYGKISNTGGSASFLEIPSNFVLLFLKHADIR